MGKSTRRGLMASVGELRRNEAWALNRLDDATELGR